MRWWTGHHGTATALDGTTFQIAGATRNTDTRRRCARSRPVAPAGRSKEWAGAADLEISRKIAARFLEKSSTTDTFSRLPRCKTA